MKHMPLALRPAAKKILLSTLLLGLFSAAAQAQTSAFPTQPLRLVVPYGAGGLTDSIARIAGKMLESEIKQSVVIENKPGAGTVVGTAYVARSTPDGYTILAGTNAGFTVAPNVQKSLPYQAQSDFTAICGIYRGANVIVAKPSFPANDLKSLLALAKSKPGALSYASFGSGSTAHLAMELIKHRAGVDILHVPYKSSAETTQALLGGQVDIAFDTLPTALPKIQAAQVKPIVITQSKRAKAAPQIGTTAEAGFEMDLGGWIGLFVPRNTPPDRQQKLAAACTALQRNEQYQQRILHLGGESWDANSAELEQVVIRESALIKDAVGVARIKPE
jgi:tripartite-type tricarboxylate transporter receptor subunit TctC